MGNRICVSISKEDYLKIDDEIFDEMSLEKIYDNAKKHWDNV
ncbi:MULTISPECIES: hypothetical protein [unclassified Sedimentibacter]|nr:hypothetical protein [Sedimentibacter sp. MB35-C1]WMJ78795.1 hypothetical protein RBQ61_07670 [Sedimentibacter sp. MB35-C1]